jgi:hypothetical protein
MPTHGGPARMLLLVILASACSRHIEDDSVPEHRIEPSQSWCAMLFDPMCPIAGVQVPTEEECVENVSENDVVWAPVDGVDECAATYLPLVECLAALPCEERQDHFAAVASDESIPTSEYSSCGPLVRPQLDCQTAHY